MDKINHTEYFQEHIRYLWFLVVSNDDLSNVVSTDLNTFWILKYFIYYIHLIKIGFYVYHI